MAPIVATGTIITAHSDDCFLYSDWKQRTVVEYSVKELHFEATVFI